MKNFFLTSALVLASAMAMAKSPDIKIADPGQNITLWDGWNVDGTIYVKLDGGTGADCIKLWWITMGINSDSWEVCNQSAVAVKLPLIYGELRAGHFKRRTAISVSDSVNVAYSQELCGYVLDCD